MKPKRHRHESVNEEYDFYLCKEVDPLLPKWVSVDERMPEDEHEEHLWRTEGGERHWATWWAIKGFVNSHGHVSVTHWLEGIPDE